jgi:LPXTG-motif cell wall-anchored protein
LDAFARHRRPHFVSLLPRRMRAAAAGTAISVIAVGTASLAFAPSAAAEPATPSPGCPAAAAITGAAQLSANAPPKLRHDKILTVEDQAGSVNVLDNDGSSGGPLTLLAVTTPAHGNVSWKPTGEVAYTPTDGYVGFDNFDYTAGDASGRTSDNGTVGVRICNVGATAEAVSLVGTFNHPVGFNPLEHASAPAGDKLSLWSYTQPAHGQTGVVGDQLVYLPDTGFFGTDNFTYTVTDGQGVCSTAPVTVRIPVDTEVSPIPPTKRSPVPETTLPETGPANVGWLALAGLLLVGLGGALLFGARLGERPAAVVRAKERPGLMTVMWRWYAAVLGQARPKLVALRARLHQPVVGGMRAPPRRRTGSGQRRRRELVALHYF